MPTSASFVDCVFEHNQALIKGAGVHMEPHAGLMLSNCTFRANIAPTGPQIAAEEPEPRVFASPAVEIEVKAPPSRGFAALSAANKDLVVESSPLRLAPASLFLSEDHEVLVALEKVCS